MWPRRTPPRQAVLAPDETEDSKLRRVSSHKMDRGPRHKNEIGPFLLQWP